MADKNTKKLADDAKKFINDDENIEEGEGIEDNYYIDKKYIGADDDEEYEKKSKKKKTKYEDDRDEDWDDDYDDDRGDDDDDYESDGDIKTSYTRDDDDDE